MDYSLGHELEDGFVEKAVEVVIRDKTATLKYYVGISENTCDELSQLWAHDQLSDPFSVKTDNEFQLQLIRRLNETVEIKINGSVRKMRPIKASDPGKHNITCVSEFEFDLDAGTNEILIVDSEFPDLDTAVRYSLKALGSTIVTKSSVAPIIIRAKRYELNSGGAIDRRDRCTINATVVTTTPVTNPANLKPK